VPMVEGHGSRQRISAPKKRLQGFPHVFLLSPIPYLKIYTFYPSAREPTCFGITIVLARKERVVMQKGKC
jgi:hypothetical protein